MDDIDKLNPPIDPAEFSRRAQIMAGNPNPAPAAVATPMTPQRTPVVASDLPDADEMFPADLPDANDLFPIDQATERNRQLNTSPIQDLFFSDWEHNPAANILRAFGQGASDDWGASKTARLSEETELFLKANKLYDDVDANSSGIYKAANQALFRPAAMVLANEARDAAAMIHGVGALFHGGLSAVGALGKEMGDPDLEMRAGSAMEAFPTGFRAAAGIHKMPHGIEAPLRNLTAEIEQAKRMNVLNGEDAYFGIAAPAKPAPPISGPNMVPPPMPKAMPVDLFEAPRSVEPIAAPTPAVEAPVAKPDVIAADVAGKLMAAGRPAEEAAVAGQLSSAFHHTRAARFEGAIGTAEDSYHAVGTDIRAANPSLSGGSEPLKPDEGGTPAPKPEPPKPPPAPAAAPKPAETAPSIVTTALKKMGHTDEAIAGMTPAEKIEIFAKGDTRPVAPPTTSGEPVPLPEKPTAEVVKQATADTAKNVWDDLAETRQEKTAAAPVTSGYNNARDRNGQKIRGKNSQVWATGNMVDVGLVKDLLITDKNADGSWKLVSKPDASGQSKTYDFKAHEGISGNPGTVDFLETAGHLQPEAARPAPAPVPAEVKAKAKRGRAGTDPQKWSLFEFLSSEGGWAHTADLHSIFGNTRGPLIPSFGPLLRKHGMSMDTALTKAKAAGYIIDPNDIQHVAGNANAGENTISVNHLHDMIDRESRGQKHYRIGQEPAAQGIDLEQQSHDIHQELDAIANESGHTVSPTMEARVVEMMQKEGETSVRASHERARSEDYYRHERLADERIDEQLAHEWDAAQSGATPEDGGESEAARRQTGRTGAGGSGELGEGARGDSEGHRGPLNSGEGQPAASEELTYDQIKRGQIRLRDGFRAVITLFKDANASTFIHETGHHWLAQLMADALHPKAPEALKTDAKTVMNWLNVESPADIKVSHHEKFARGFERYMMEGKAPSQALANVFAKFKAWLTQIYGSVTKLKAPINNDIRGVFDRMLSIKPGEVKIEPDLVEHSIADLHEADAASTPDHMAHPAAETAQAERDTVATGQLPKDIADARLADVKGEAERRAPGNPESGGPADEAGHIGEGQGDAGPSGTIGEGGNDAAPVGDPPPPNARPTENPLSPNDKFPDKAGNIVLKNLNTPEDLNSIIRQSATDNGDYQNVRGPISDAQVMDLAEAAGVDAAFIDAAKLAQHWNAPQIVALRRLLIESAQSVHDIAKKAAGGVEADVLAYAEAVMRHRLIQETVSGVTAEAGRALRAFQARFTEGMGLAIDVGKALEDIGSKTLFQLQQEATYLSKLQTPGQASKFVHDTGKGALRSAVLEYYVNALISGPVTHLRYIVSNAVNALWTPLVEIPIASVVGKSREMVSGEKVQRVHLGEAGAQLYGLIQGSRNGLYAAIEAFTSGVSPALPTERVSPQFAEASRAIPGPVGSVIRIPGKSVAGIHSFFKSLRYEQNINGIAWRTASNEGLTGDAFSNRVSDLTTTPSEAMMREATSNALRELYMSPTDYHSPMGGLVRFTNSFLPAKIIVPFMKIGSQITRAAFVDKFATGLASGKVRATLGEGGAAADLQSGRIVAGTALFAASFGMAAEGLMTGDGPSDPKERSVWLMSHKPNTLTIGDMTFNYGNTGPLGMLMRTAANMHELGHVMDAHGAGAVATEFFEAMAKSVLDETFLRGFKDMLDAVFHPKEYGSRYAVAMVTNWIPWSVGLSQVARKIDPVMRETKGISSPMEAVYQAAQAKIPWASKGLMPRRDMFGEPIRWDGPNPDYANDPVVKAMDALNGSGVGRMSRKINGIALTDQQYDDVSRLAGRDAKMRLNAMVGIIGNPQVPAGVRIDMIHKAITSSREMARKLVMMQSIGSENDIMKASIEAKTIKKTALTPTQ